MRSRLAILVLLVSGTSSAQEPTGNAERGQALFLEIACYSCHGFNGTGMTPLSPKTSGVLSSATVFLTYMRLRGDENQLYPSRQMPHYGEEVMTDKQVLDIYAYLVTLDDRPPAVEDIPAFKEVLEDARKKQDSDSNPE